MLRTLLNLAITNALLLLIHASNGSTYLDQVKFLLCSFVFHELELPFKLSLRELFFTLQFHSPRG